MSAAVIAEVRAEPLEVPLIEPFTIALSSLEATANVLVTVVLEDGTEGLGEAAPWKELTGETQASVLAAVDAARELLVGTDVHATRALSERLRDALPGDSSARAGITSAILDAATRAAGVPLWRHLGGTGRALEIDMTIPIVPPTRARERAAELVAQGFRMIKVKVGSDLEEDMARLRAIREAAPEVGLIVDANQGYTPEQALDFLERAGPAGVTPALFEQPVAADDLEGLARVTLATEVPVAADEAVARREDALRVAAARAADVINIKLMKCGGILEALDIAAIARAAGIRLMIGGMVETRLGMGTSAHLAAGLGGFDFLDLDTHLLLAEDPFVGGFEQTGPHMELGDAPGHGIRRR
jgi:L-alanine-DL-glutamate epimerase-like enolase superfamily enzyme